jgi:hypothetical protein
MVQAPLAGSASGAKLRTKHACASLDLR